MGDREPEANCDATAGTVVPCHQKPFCDDLTEVGALIGVLIWEDDFNGSPGLAVECEWDDDKRPAAERDSKHGTAGKKRFRVTNDPENPIVKIEGKSASWIDSLRFYAEKDLANPIKAEGPSGKDTFGKEWHSASPGFTVAIHPETSVLRGFFGSSGTFLDAIGMLFREKQQSAGGDT